MNNFAITMLGPKNLQVIDNQSMLQRYDFVGCDAQW
jgi:hypothetical protein